NPVLLFRYSALTFNGHRIHYDYPYVTGVEGYPGLIVHGPLLGTLQIELARRSNPGRTPATFEFRALSPVFAGAAFTVGRGASRMAPSQLGSPIPPAVSLNRERRRSNESFSSRRLQLPQRAVAPWAVRARPRRRRRRRVETDPGARHRIRGDAGEVH